MVVINAGNVDQILDAGMLYVHTHGERWLQARRNGRTKRWVTDTDRIRVPIKYGFRSTDQVTDEALRRNAENGYFFFRHHQDIPPQPKRK